VRDLLHHIEQSILRRRLFRDDQSILVAVSGGMDSMVLLRILHELSPKHHWKLAVAHLNHQLRGRSSDADERLVRQTAKKMQMRVVAQRADVKKFAQGHGLSLEMAARKLRHDFLARTAIQLRVATIALAHHADDQLELFFLRLFRGSGGEGLAGMKWRSPSPSDRQIDLVRPLLDLPKSDLGDYAAAKNVHFREDASNACLDFQRNRIRHELLPLLRRKYQPALHKTIPRLMEIVGSEAELVTQAARNWLPANVHTRGPSTIEPRSSTPFDSLPVAVQRRSIQLQLLGLGLDADYELIETLRLAAEQPVSIPNRTAAGPPPVRHYLVRSLAGLVQLRPQPIAGFQANSLELELAAGQGQVVFDGVRISWRTEAKRGNQLPTRTSSCEFFDAEKVGSQIQLRHWQRGDRFQPSGRSNSVKLQDFFTNEKIPRPQRHQLVVAAAGNNGLFWVEGLRISERFKLTKYTKRRLQWQWERI
jgi:tRNA(Ile)-lysidine synthase